MDNLTREQKVVGRALMVHAETLAGIETAVLSRGVHPGQTMSAASCRSWLKARMRADETLKATLDKEFPESLIVVPGRGL